MNITEERKSEFFNILAWMGLLNTEEYRIRSIREKQNDNFMYLDLTYEDIERVGYYYPHFTIDHSKRDYCEFWYQDQYLNPKSLEWIETVNGDCGITTDRKFDELNPVIAIHNPSILERFTEFVGNDTEELMHVTLIDINDPRYEMIENIEHCAYYISQNQIKIPQVDWVDDHTIRFKCPYKYDIDFFICSNLINITTAEANTSVYLDQPHSARCNHMIFIDNDLSYPIDARFYPCIRVDKDCTIRIYNDNSSIIRYPDVCRIINYPEFLDVEDPYNDARLVNFPKIDLTIESSDSDEEIITKFSEIAKYFYRMWEKFPFDMTEQSDFVICDNSKLTEKAFVKVIAHLYDTDIEKIISTVPAEGYRDLLIMNGSIFSDYIIRNMKVDTEDNYVESDNGMPCYIIDASYDPDQFSCIKFNTAEDTTIMNIGDYVDPENIAHLHYKLNRFYRNMMAIRMMIYDMDEVDKARVATVQPESKDRYLWYELVLNAIPEMFTTRPIDAIDLFKLNPDSMPSDIKEGAYRLELDPSGGPESYTELLMTYFKLNSSQKKYLALQYGDGQDDPRVQVFHDFTVGVQNNPELNEMNIPLDQPNPARRNTEYADGYKEDPSTETGHTYTEGDIYVEHLEQKPDPGEDNIQIENIEYGPTTPEPSENTLWIDKPDDRPRKDSMDGVIEKMYITNDSDKIDAPDTGDFAMDALLDDLLPEQEGEASIDEIFDGTDLLSDIANAVANNTSVDEIENPLVGQIALDDISYMNAETGKSITKEEIAALPHDDKVNLAKRYFMDDDVPKDANIGDLWNQYFSASREELLNTIVHKILLSRWVLGMEDPELGTLAIEGEDLPEEEDTVAIGDHLEKVRPHQLLLHTDFNDDGTRKPDYDVIKHEAVKYILSIYEPDQPEQNMLWFGIPAVVKEEIIRDVISSTIHEIGEKMPEGVYIDTGYNIYATTGFDYVPHDKGTEGVGDVYQEKIDETLHKVYFGETDEGIDFEQDDLWYEFLDDMHGKVAYSDTNCMIIRIDERLILVKFDPNEEIQAFAFDDIMINFHGKLGVKYLSIIADLLNSGEIKDDQVNVWYKRLITFGDQLKPNLKRLYTGTSHVLTTNKIDTTDFSVMYSTNIGRFRMNYNEDTLTEDERSAAYQQCIDYRRFTDFAYLKNRMLIFINGKYISRANCVEDFPGKIQINNFNEIITTIDILYSKKDQHLIDLKRKAMEYNLMPDNSQMIERPERDYHHMEPIREMYQTKKGYYDILLDEYIFNGKLMRILNYLDEHPDEIDGFKKDIKQYFDDISDHSAGFTSPDKSRIIIPAFGKNEPAYQIGE